MTSPDEAAYKKALARLVARARAMRATEGESCGPRRKDVQGIAKDLDALCTRLQSTMNCSALLIEDLHDARRNEALAMLPYSSILWGMRDLADAAHLVEKSLSRATGVRKPSLPWAARAFLRVRYACGYERPTLYAWSDSVEEFGKIWASVCNSDECPLAPETLLGALTSALKDFDLFLPDSSIDDLIQ